MGWYTGHIDGLKICVERAPLSVVTLDDGRCSVNVGTWHSGRVCEWAARRPGCRDREGCDESTEVVTDSLTLLLCPEAQGGENEGCIWKDLALLGHFLFLLL